ncbi:unnamed protein product [Adineta ricciae]|uniref:B box-type domain-containing protein n=1 Tax=Adineta ricciae TaxID=249248 RepID=A0A815W4N7_ADIRI|nr:unnamed protein product [Adineta ricciae]CAF1539004.1 unnamed protein product [Adineta ricciae]
MAHQSMSSTAKTNCRQCAPKPVAAITSCKGCSEDFCRKHFNEHRDQLSNQLHVVINQHDNILQSLQPQAASRSNTSRVERANQLLQQIEQWKTNAIGQVMRVAKDATDTIERLFNTEIQLQKLRERTRVITKELRDQEESDSFVESDIQRWTKQLEEIKNDATRPLPFAIQPPKIEIQSIPWDSIIKIHSAPPSTKTTNRAQAPPTIFKPCHHPLHYYTSIIHFIYIVFEHNATFQEPTTPTPHRHKRIQNSRHTNK